MTKIYHTKMADALPSKKRVAEEKARLEKAGIKYILSCWIDMLGLPKTKPIPFAEFEALCAGKGHNLLYIQSHLFQNWGLMIRIKFQFQI